MEIRQLMLIKMVQMGNRESWLLSHLSMVQIEDWPRKNDHIGDDGIKFDTPIGPLGSAEDGRVPPWQNLLHLVE